MIDFTKYEEVLLEDVADYERAKDGHIVMEKNIDEFMMKYATGLNIQEKEVGKFPIQLHNTDTQKAIVKMIDHINTQIDISEQELYVVKKFKQTMLNKMMV